MKRIIAVNSNCYHGYAIEEAVAGIRRAGFHYIELTATKGWTEHVFPDMPFERLLEIQDLLRRNELIPFSMSGHCNLMDPERIPDFEKNIRLAAFFGCQYIVSSIGEAHLANQAVADDHQVARSVSALIPMLEQHNLDARTRNAREGARHGRETGAHRPRDRQSAREDQLRYGERDLLRRRRSLAGFEDLPFGNGLYSHQG